MNKTTLRMFTVALLMLPTLAYAQELNLKVTPPEADMIWKGLRKLPVEEVEQLMTKLRQQVVNQTQPKPSEPKTDVPATPQPPN